MTPDEDERASAAEPLANPATGWEAEAPRRPEAAAPRPAELEPPAPEPPAPETPDAGGIQNRGDEASDDNAPAVTRAEWRELADEVRRLAAQIAHGRA